MSELKNQIYPIYKPYKSNELVFYSSSIKDNKIIDQIFNLYNNLLLQHNKSNVNIILSEITN